MMVLTGWSLNSNDVTTPKFPPPPRSAQNRSGSVSALAVTNRPSARTTSAEIRLSQESPYFRVRWPIPPPSVSPAIPVVEMIPPGAARPNAWVAWSRSPQVHPPSARAVRFSGSTRIPFIPDRSTTTPPSQTALPVTLWLPPRIATGSPCSRAKPTAAITSATPAQRAISAGLRSIIPFQTLRASS